MFYPWAFEKQDYGKEPEDQIGSVEPNITLGPSSNSAPCQLQNLQVYFLSCFLYKVPVLTNADARHKFSLHLPA